MKTPFYQIKIFSSGRDITNKITSFKFSDSIEKDNTVVLSIDGAGNFDFDDPDLRKGTYLMYQFGQYKGRISPKRIARISKIDYSYGTTRRATITATDLGIRLKKAPRNKVWTNKTTHQIITSIAEEHGLNIAVRNRVDGKDELSKEHEFMPQTNETDWDFMQRLIQLDGHGLFVGFAIDDNIVVKNRNLNGTPHRTYTWNFGNGVVLSFNPSTNDQKTDIDSTKAKTVGVDPMLGEVVETESDDDSVGLGKEKYAYSANGVGELKKSEESKVPEEEMSRTIPVSTDSVEESQSISNKRKEDALINNMEASLKIELDATLKPDKIITMGGVAKVHRGNWYATEINHSISGSVATTILKLKKNSNDLSDDKNPEALNEVNEKKGPNDESGTETTKEVRVVGYDNTGQKKG